MLIYETEGFLEVEAKHIQQLCRSTAAVSLDETERESTTLRAVLCDYLDNSEPRCRVALFSKVLKRAFVFAVKGSARHSPWQCGQNVLVQLGFRLENVNLKLSPAMLEVVLRDVPGLLSPAEARKQRTEKSSLLAELHKTFDEAADSTQGKKAALKLSAEKRLNTQAEEVRHFLEELLSSKENASAEFEALVSQVKDLTSRLETSVALAESERNHREMSESITLAAEKRIQELEEILVDVETTSSKTIKQKQKNVQLRTRIKELGRELEVADAEIEKEREKHEQFIADVNAAHEQIALLENDLKEMEASRAAMQTQLAEEQAAKAQLAESSQKAELRIKTLGAELKNAEKQAAVHNESAGFSAKIQTQLAEVQVALRDSLELNSALEEKLMTADEQNEELIERLETAEKKANDNTRDETQVVALTEQNEQLVSELEGLGAECDQERSIRKRLEKAAAEGDKRIQELENSLAIMSQSLSERSSHDEDSKADGRQLASLQAELRELKQQFNDEQKCRDGLESEVEDAHKLIDSLEKMVRETEAAATGQRSHETSNESDNQVVQELEKKLLAVENQLEHERVEQKKLIRAVVVAEHKLAEQEEMLAQGQVLQMAREIQEHPVAQSAAQKPSKPLPHELRPAPKKGSLFHPDWELGGLPCQSSEQVFKAWETVFNVQTSLEGYPSQYCMAFLVVLRQKKQKSIYMLYRLKLNKHTLVCVPSKTPKDQASLKQTIKDGLNFLKMSGFDMEEMSIENIDSTLKSYFLVD